MKPPKNPPEPHYVTVACEHCDGGIEFDANQLDGDKTRIVECPHCHLETIVFVPDPDISIISPKRPANKSQSCVVSVSPPLNLTPPEKLYASRVYVANIEELSAITRHFADVLELQIDAGAIERIARSADGAPLEVLNRLRRVQDYARAKGNDKKITADIAEEVLKALPKLDKTNEINANANNNAVEIQLGRKGIPSHVRIEVWRRDGGKCVKCGSREKLEYDHIIPVSKGGSNTARNIELLCEDCNRSKRDSIQ
jgi:HNH endonuclease/RuvB AAA lid domain